MFNREVNAVLTVIALSIFADKRVLSTEISAFINSVDVIKANIRSDLVLTEAKLLVWFEMNQEDLRAKMKLGTDEFQHWFETKLKELALLPDKKFILDVVESIAHADGELHISEKALSVMLNEKFKKIA